MGEPGFGGGRFGWMERVGTTCIVNCAAGSSRCASEAERLKALFVKNKLEADMIVAHGPDVALAAERAVRGGSAVVVGVGGDGTMNAIAGALVGTDVALGVVPLGTFNHFAK